MAAATAQVDGNVADILGDPLPLNRDPIIIFTLSQPGIALDGTFVGSFDRRVQIQSDGAFDGDLIPSTTMRADGRVVYYKIKLGVRDPGAEYRLIDLPQFQLHVPPSGGHFSDLVIAPPPALIIARGMGAPPEWFVNTFYVDMSGPKPELYGPANGGI
ncbi:hypothetical protein SCB71_06265 [Herbiconiux sp. KACC 21604]|uniref:hypothetical protein n=1 Tax=unclassified Herbiconiux TaxID=2618217 RepID=UPI001490EA9E|nr:hypothetical protein [Herbiconiux sp. SALV-R1]QJU52922.1 hypothetical protein HL652_04250 [Herbiconiux sp. SALV-R1]WPO87842.1 hypothetical protein SCB71_06265 [Herbiconiux sp. KACC 21604]